MRKLHKLFHDTFLETCRNHFDTPEDKSNYYILVPFGEALIGFNIDYSIENYKGGRDYDICVFVKSYEEVVNSECKPLPNITIFLHNEYWLKSFYL